MKYIFLFSAFFYALLSEAQSFRGLSVLNDNQVFVSGSKGTVLKTLNGGKTWDTISPKGYENREFRDIHAYNSKHILVMSSGDSGVILYTENGGDSWTVALSKNDSGTFFDAMDFCGKFGVLIGDPIFDESGKAYFDLFMSDDYGKTWDYKNDWVWKTQWKASKGEALFAASGSNIILSIKNKRKQLEYSNIDFEFATGGTQSWLYKSGLRMSLMFDTCATCGVYGMARGKYDKLVMVGGNYLLPDSQAKTAMYFDLAKGFYELSEKMPGGYRSGVAYSPNNNNNIWICTGTNGSDISKDEGKTWNKIEIPGFNVCAFSNKFLWVAGNKGQVFRYPISMFLEE